MVLCVAILLLQGNNKYTPLIVEQRGVMTKKVAFENIYQVIIVELRQQKLFKVPKIMNFYQTHALYPLA